MSYFNEEQEDYMHYLSSLPADKKCKCGWYMLGECYNCELKDGGNGYVERVKAKRDKTIGK